MPGMLSQVKWGTGEENVLTFEFPFDNIRTYRLPRDGSSRVRIPGAGFDPWVNGRDYILEGDARWLSFLKQSDPVGVQAFIDWAANGTFSFVPDSTVPDFALPGCFLIAPFDAPDPGSEQSGEAIQRLVIGNPTYNFAQALRGIMFEYAPGASLTDPVAATFSRASVATRIAKLLGLEPLATEAANVLRDRHYEGSLKTALLEAARENLIENGDYEADAVGSTLAGGATIVRDGTNVRRGSWALKITTANADLSGVLIKKRDGSRTPASASTAYAPSLWVYAPTAAVGKTLRLDLDWYSAVPAFISQSSVQTVLVAGWQRIPLSATSPAGTASVEMFFRTAGAQGVFDIWVDMVQFEAGAFASSAISTGTGAVTRNGERFNWLFGYKPQAKFFYTKFVHRNPTTTGNQYVLSLMGDADSAPRLVIFWQSSTSNYVIYHNGIGVGIQTGAVPTPVFGDIVELACLLYPDGHLQLRQSINGGAESVNTQAAPEGLAAAWNGGGGAPKVWIGSSPTGAEIDTGLVRVKFGPLTFSGITRDTIAKALAA